MSTTVQGTFDNDGPHYEVVKITPHLAKEWLERNTHNRNLRQRVVNGYAADIAAGAWAEDGQSIKFATDGALLDGQHRLAAIVQSGVPLRMLVVTNLPNSTQDTMDSGAKRTLGDALKLRGEANYVTVAAALLRIYQWQAGARRSVGRGGNSDIRPTHRQLLQLLEDHPEIRRSAEIGVRVRNALPISSGCTALCHWLFNQIDAGDCAFFFARLADGAGLQTDDAIYALRRSAEMNAKDKSRSTAEFYTVALVIKAWNFYREGRPVRLLQFKTGGAAPEQFPEPK
jgi:hypothetical protein